MRNAFVGSLPLTMALTVTAFATPFGDAGRGFRDGANHHLGDDGFIARFGRVPVTTDREGTRMKTHLQHVRSQLASAPATKPAFAAKRAEILGYLDDYIAKGITPVNEHLPWRTPVFIDDHGNICAVGYLIERDVASAGGVGRALPERIAKTHRYEFLEDIAAAMPQVRDWVATSGFTLDELSSIQPGYAEPEIEAFGRVDYTALKIPDGEYSDKEGNGDTSGRLRKGHMEGTWTRMIDGKLAGKGEMSRGRGTWTSYYPDGKKLAVGPFYDDDPHGAWTFFHPSGNVAATGKFSRGYRDGAWQFFNDEPTRPLLASGRFSNGSIGGTWRHYDAGGKLLAISRDAGNGRDPMSRGGVLLTIVPGKDRVQHEVHSFGGMDSRQLHMVALGNERLYLELGETIYDAGGNALKKTADGWTASACKWSPKRKAIARNGDVTTLHRLLVGAAAAEKCGDPRPVSQTRAAAITATLGVLATVRAPSPAFVKQLALGDASIKNTLAEATDGEASDSAKSDDGDDSAADLARILAASLGWYVEYPHIDGRFVRVFQTIPGQWRKEQIDMKRYEIENPS